MAKCDYCGSSILFGGVTDGDLRFCSKNCQQKGYPLVVSREIPKHVVDQQLYEIHRGLCPKCQGSGPIDVHTSYRIYSLLLYSSWSSRPLVGCKSCGRKAQIADTFFSLFFGWWGFPWGLIMTPVQVVRNISSILTASDPIKPSDKLENIVRVSIASQLLAQQQKSTT